LAEPILLTGGTGTVGREILRLLRDKGHPVRAAVSPRRLANLANTEQVEYVPFDFADHTTYGPALAGVRTLFLMRPPAISDTKTYIDPFIAAASQARVEHVVFLSLLGAERNPVVPHHRIETSLSASGMGYTFLRPSFFMQNLSGAHQAEIRRGRIVVPAGHGRTSFIDARDIASVGAPALTLPGHEQQAYALTGSEALDYFQVAEVMTDVLGHEVRYTHPGLLQFARRMHAARQPWDLTMVMAGIYTTARLGLAATVTDELPRLLGRPPISLRQFVQDNTACWSTEPKKGRNHA
jgi:uncharacterized protein YbjT (DUF2867 family)